MQVEGVTSAFGANGAEPASPASSYECGIAREFGADVPALPAQLGAFAATGCDGMQARCAPHVRMEHLFGRVEGEVRTLALSSRYRSKTITTLFVTPSSEEG